MNFLDIHSSFSWKYRFIPITCFLNTYCSSREWTSTLLKNVWVFSLSPTNKKYTSPTTKVGQNALHFFFASFSLFPLSTFWNVKFLCFSVCSWRAQRTWQVCNRCVRLKFLSMTLTFRKANTISDTCVVRENFLDCDCKCSNFWSPRCHWPKHVISSLASRQIFSSFLFSFRVTRCAGVDRFYRKAVKFTFEVAIFARQTSSAQAFFFSSYLILERLLGDFWTRSGKGFELNHIFGREAFSEYTTIVNETILTYNLCDRCETARFGLRKPVQTTSQTFPRLQENYFMKDEDKISLTTRTLHTHDTLVCDSKW